MNPTATPALRPVWFAALAVLAASQVGCGNDNTLIGLAPEIVVDPDHLIFDSVQLGTVETQDVKVINAGSADLVLSALTLANASPELILAGDPTVLPAGEQLILHVTFTPVDADGVEDKILITNNATEDPVEVPITATTAGEVVPDIFSDPPGAEFGEVEITTSTSQVFQIGNAGFADLTVTELTLTADPEFSLTDDGGLVGATIPAGGSPILVTVTYEPQGIEENHGVLYVASNDPDEPILEIPLDGEGSYPGGDGPVAVCSVDPTEAVPFQTLSWSGDDSYDTSGRPLVAYTWTVVAFPDGSSAMLQGSGPNRSTETDLAGSYTAQLVVSNDLGQVSPPCEATAEVVPTENLWIEMFWTHSGDDMDLHLLAPGGSLETGTDCYYGNCVGIGLDWGTNGYVGDNPVLDLDDIPGTGPENINISDPQDGVFTVVVNDYPGSVYNGSNPTTVNIYVDGSLAGSFTDDMGYSEDHYWYVAEVDWPTGAVTEL